MERIVFSSSIQIGDWFGSLDLIVIPLDNHTLILGHKFLGDAKADLLIHRYFLLFLG